MSAVKGRWSRVGWNAFAALVGLLFLVPFVWLVVTAFVNNGGLDISFNHGFTVANFAQLLSSAQAATVGESAAQALLNSLYLCGGTTILTTLIAILTGYPLSRFHIPGRGFIVYAVVFVTGLPIIAIVIPTYDIFVTLGFVNSLFWTIMFLTATSLPFGIWIAKNFIDAVPFELEEAAATEGAGVFHIMRYITGPLIVPGALVIAIYTFIQSWSNFFVPFILLQTPQLPAAVTIYQYFGQHSVSYSGLAAFAIVFTAVPLILYILLSRRTGGVSMFSGAIRG